jgi:clan AA aspartic protease (TIGR02281 family)
MWFLVWDSLADMLLAGAATCALLTCGAGETQKPQSKPTPVVQPAPNGSRRVAVNGDSSYQCYVDATVGGVTFSFLIDTGSADVSFGKNDARKLGFDPAQLSFDRAYSSANGIGHQAEVTLPDLSIGGVVVARNVEASIVNASMSNPLLGASVLRSMHLHYSQGNCELVLPGAGTVTTKRVSMTKKY